MYSLRQWHEIRRAFCAINVVLDQHMIVCEANYRDPIPVVFGEGAQS